MHLTPLSLALALSLALTAHAQPTSASVALPARAPPGAPTLAPTLLAFSLEQDRWPAWAGVAARNAFTHSALAAYAGLTGRPPKLRVGADSEDRTVWAPTVTVEEDAFPPPTVQTPYPVATTIVVGDEYYRLSRWLPTGTRMVWGVNLGLDNVTNAVNMAKAIMRAFADPAVIASGVSLERIEVGNEADQYGLNGLRAANWTVQEYVPDWEGIAGPVVEAAGNVGRTGPVTLQGAAFVSHNAFTPREIFALGILDSTAGQTISTISQHQYSAAFCSGGDFDLISFMNKTSIRGNLTVFEEDIAATRARGLDYILGETNSIACEGAPGVSNTAGAALWVIDYTLFASTIGISELYYHEGVGFKYNFMQPVALNRSITNGSALDPPEPPHIMPAYYGGLVVNTFIGDSGAARIVELTVDEPDITGYAAFEGGELARAVFVNLDAWVVNSTGTRPSTHIDLSFVNGTASGSTAAARRLVINHADDTQNLTWAGQSYEETAEVSATGQLEVETIDLTRGFDLRATEAILLVF